LAYSIVSEDSTTLRELAIETVAELSHSVPSNVMVLPVLKESQQCSWQAGRDAYEGLNCSRVSMSREQTGGKRTYQRSASLEKAPWQLSLPHYAEVVLLMEEEEREVLVQRCAKLQVPSGPCSLRH
jgi:hypothetical protein